MHTAHFYDGRGLKLPTVISAQRDSQSAAGAVQAATTRADRQSLVGTRQHVALRGIGPPPSWECNSSTSGTGRPRQNTYLTLTLKSGTHGTLSPAVCPPRTGIGWTAQYLVYRVQPAATYVQEKCSAKRAPQNVLMRAD